MATFDNDSTTSEEKVSVASEITSPEALAGAIATLSLQDAKPSASSTHKTHDDSQRPMIVYTRAQLLYLHNSPLVKAPDGFPDLKYWFGYVRGFPCVEHHLPPIS